MQLNQGNETSAASNETQEVFARRLSRTYNLVRARLEDRKHIPSATYRLQFNRFFTFQDARKLAGYLQQLGVSDVYASPYFKARPESLHGYDIANHNELNPSIGSEGDYNAFVDELHKQGLHQILDTVPNHMGIGGESNIWWTDVLENGRSSLFAPFFDIDWEPLNTKLTYKVLLPVLGDQYGRVLENGELQIHFIPEEGRFVLRYWENSFPLNPRSYEIILGVDRDRLLQELEEDNTAAIEYQSILTALSHLPRHWDTSRESALERNREKEVIKKRLAVLCAQEPRVCDSIERGLVMLNGEKGEPHSFDLLDSILEQQPYRLSFWRVATEEINYRRFFDVNDLAAIQVDQPQVFEETHRMIMRFLGEGKLDGVRVDHVDGLRDPLGYMRAVQRAYFLETCRVVLQEADQEIGEVDRAELELALLEQYEADIASGDHSLPYRPLYLVVEKILGRGEDLPADWPVYGTTGYEYTNAVNGLFVDSANERAFDDIYSAFIGDELDLTDMVYESKKGIMRLSLSSEVNLLTNMLNRISERDRSYRDFTISGLRNAIREVIACFSVYRTYITPERTQPERRDLGVIESAVAAAKRRNPATDPSVFDFLRDILLLRGHTELDEAMLQERWDFVMKFQQVTGPVTAKGIEDTVFYVYNRLISLNEVGGEPDLFGVSPEHFHEEQKKRLHAWPHSMLTTSTHDTKRSEDVRARINVLSELPKEWRTAVKRWARFNRKYKRRIEGQAVPDTNEEYFLYQTLVGVWPFKDDLAAEEHDDVIARVQQYMGKALNEAKVHTSWINTHEEYLAAVSAFIADILRRDDSNRFLADFLPFQQRIARYGIFNSLSQTLLKLTSPGVPDIYQGTELWDLSLVDPDNRRPVDYDLRRRLMSQVDKVADEKGVARLLDTPEDGRIKLFVTSRALRFRAEHRALFDNGQYVPIRAEGKYSECAVAFARRTANKSIVVAVPRFLTRLGGTASSPTAPVGEVWADTELVLPEDIEVQTGTRFRNVFTGALVEVRKHEGRTLLNLSDLFAVLPFALLETNSDQ